MAKNESLSARVREALQKVKNVEEKDMFRGTTFMVNGKMCITTGNHELMCRIDPKLHAQAASGPGCRPMIMKGREYKGYVYIQEEVIADDKVFAHWINLALDFNRELTLKEAKKKK